MRCHYTYHPDFGKVHIPGCWAAALHGPYYCDCYNPKKEPNPQTEKETQLLKQIKELETEKAQLNRIIKHLLEPKRHNHGKEN